MPNIFGAVKADFVAYNKLTTVLRHDLRIFARISEFPCFHETKQAQNEIERFFPQLGRICFRILLRQSENFSDFSKVLSQFAFRNMIVPFYTSSAENRVNFQRGDWTGVKWSSQLRKTNFLTLPDLAFDFVHKRSGNEISNNPKFELGF